VRVGLHAGQVASDPADAEDGRGGGAHGLTIHLASRVVGMAQPGETCVTAACRAAAGAACRTTPLGAHALKGIPGLVDLYRLTEVRDTGRAGAGAFRGRQRELDRLCQSLREALDGRSGVVGIAGDPGSGKSRLCQEFAEICRTQGVPVHEVRAQLYGHALPLQPVLELFRVHFLGVEPSDDAATVRDRIARRFAAVATSASDLAIVHDFFGVGDSEPVHPLGPRARQARLKTLLRALLRAEAAIPRVLLIEDLHWLDEGSEEFVSLLVEALPGTHSLLLLNYRPSYRCPWLQQPSYLQIQLDELGRDDMQALVEELLAPATRSEAVRQLVCGRAGGNPFFAEELIRSLVESRLLPTDGDPPQAALEAIERAMPATLEAVVGARLDRLGEPDKTLLQMCAIIGKDIPMAVLERVAGGLSTQIGPALDRLCSAGLLLPQAADGGQRLAFRHPLIQEVAYGTQFRMRRGPIHADVAAAMESHFAERIEEYAGLIGYHLEQAGRLLESARYNARAAAWIGNTNPGQAIRHWRKVRSLLETVPGEVEVNRLRVTAASKIALLGWRDGMTLAEVKPLIDEAMSLANQGDDRLVPWLLTIEGRMLVASGGAADGYVDCVRKALLYIDPDLHPGRVGLAHAFLGHAYSWAGLLQQALAATDVALQHVAQVDAFDRDFIGFSIEHWVLAVRARVLVRLGRADDARACLERVARLEGATAEAPVPGMASLGYIELAWLIGDAELARRHAHELRLLADRHGTAYVRTFAEGYRGVAALLAGDVASAQRCLTAALEHLRATGAAREFETEILALLAECRLRTGDPAGAEAAAGEAMSLSQARCNRMAECRSHIVRGAARRAMGAVTAEADFVAAQALIAQTGALSLERELDRARRFADAERAA